MPELIEVETYRRAAAPLVGRRLGALEVLAPGYGPGDAAWWRSEVEGRRVEGVGRRGKLLWLDLEGSDRLGLRFGMTGRLVVDGVAAIEELEYGPAGVDPSFVRFACQVRRGRSAGSLALVDPRRLGSLSWNPDVEALGPDAATVTAAQLRSALAGSTQPLKARMLDQSRIAGVGNLIADDALWRAGLAPGRSAGGLTPEDVSTLAAALRNSVRRLSRRGGSHTGDLQPLRRHGGPCPRCAGPVRRSRVGGRTTWWCPGCQR